MHVGHFDQGSIHSHIISIYHCHIHKSIMSMKISLEYISYLWFYSSDKKMSESKPSRHYMCFSVKLDSLELFNPWLHSPLLTLISVLDIYVDICKQLYAVWKFIFPRTVLKLCKTIENMQFYTEWDCLHAKPSCLSGEIILFMWTKWFMF